MRRRASASLAHRDCCISGTLWLATMLAPVVASGAGIRSRTQPILCRSDLDSESLPRVQFRKGAQVAPGILRNQRCTKPAGGQEFMQRPTGGSCGQEPSPRGSIQPDRAAQHSRWGYSMELATIENTLFDLPPMIWIVPTTITRITASMTAYS